MNRLSIRARMAVAFAAAMLAVLALAGLFVYLYLANQLDGRSGERLPLPPATDEIHDLGATLNVMLARIEEGLNRERQFVADASHELRTPLANMQAELELAERPGRSPEEMRAAIASTADEVDRLTRLANDLLLIARSDQGRLPIASERVGLLELLERVAGRFVVRAGDRSLKVEADPAATVRLDPMRVEQALGNCVDNALRHGGGEITLRGAVEVAGGVVLEVADRGEGLADDLGESAFERFARGGAGRTGEGAGLGLAIVRAIARAHGGEAEIGVRGDGGTVVRLRLPAAHPGDG